MCKEDNWQGESEKNEKQFYLQISTSETGFLSAYIFW